MVVMNCLIDDCFVECCQLDAGHVKPPLLSNFHRCIGFHAYHWINIAFIRERAWSNQLASMDYLALFYGHCGCG